MEFKVRLRDDRFSSNTTPEIVSMPRNPSTEAFPPLSQNQGSMISPPQRQRGEEFPSLPGSSSSRSRPSGPWNSRTSYTPDVYVAKPPNDVEIYYDSRGNALANFPPLAAVRAAQIMNPLPKNAKELKERNTAFVQRLKQSMGDVGYKTMKDLSGKYNRGDLSPQDYYRDVREMMAHDQACEILPGM